MLRTTMLHRFLLVSLFVVMTASQPGSVSAGINGWTSSGSEGGTFQARADRSSQAGQPLEWQGDLASPLPSLLAGVPFLAGTATQTVFNHGSIVAAMCGWPLRQLPPICQPR